MWKEGAAILAAVAVPAILLAKMSGAPNMNEKIIEIYGTYLPSPDPMDCGEGDMGPAATARVSQFFEKVAGWPNYRAIYPMGKWEEDTGSCKLPVGRKECMALLEEAGVDFEPVEEETPGIDTPVRLGPVVNGVMLDSKVDLLMSCDLALAVVKMTKTLSKKNVDGLGIFSLYRPESTYSFHSLGLGIDINWVKSKSWAGGVWVKTNFEKSMKFRTCDYKTTTKRAGLLMDVVCTLWEEKIFNTVLTPNYNEAHHNHFHVDVRPGDNRFYLR
jgi:hypothetical protein